MEQVPVTYASSMQDAMEGARGHANQEYMAMSIHLLPDTRKEADEGETGRGVTYMMITSAVSAGICIEK